MLDLLLLLHVVDVERIKGFLLRFCGFGHVDDIGKVEGLCLGGGTAQKLIEVECLLRLWLVLVVEIELGLLRGGLACALLLLVCCTLLLSIVV